MKTPFTGVVGASGHKGLRNQLSTPAFLPRGATLGTTREETGTAADRSGGSAWGGS